jgi:beta-N-acetylhexosaminidase
LDFEGVTVSDALDMTGATYADGLSGTVVAAAEAGMDLLLMNHADEIEESAFEALRRAIASGKLEAAGLIAARDRILRLREHLATMVQPPLEAVGSAEHRRLAREIAEASVTLVRDPQASLPLHRSDGRRIAVVAPAPVDLTPAETSSYLQIELAGALRERGFAADEFEVPLDPSASCVDALISATAGHETVIVCTFDAVSFAGQRSLIDRAAALRAGDGGRLVAVATRSPYDVATYPATVTAVCTYGVQPTQIEALADALAGLISFAGRLPVRLEADR